MGQGGYIFGCEGPVLCASEATFFKDSQPFAFILFARNIETPDQLTHLTRDLREAVGRDPLILIDQEGGRVQRMRGPHWRDWVPALDQCARAGENAPRSMWLRARLIADELRAVGIDANCAPLGDIVYPDTHAVLRNRCYGDTAEQVARIARAVAEGQMAGGVMAVLKHLPGHGRASLDSHLSLPHVKTSLHELRDTDFSPFRALSDLPMAMTAHILFDDIDQKPATQSEIVIDLIRNDIGFQGLLISDDISMNALGGHVVTRARAALAAGCDLVLHCNGDMAEMRLIANLGAMNLAAQTRADNAIVSRPIVDPIDIAGAEQELASLVQGGAYV